MTVVLERANFGDLADLAPLLVDLGTIKISTTTNGQFKKNEAKL